MEIDEGKKKTKDGNCTAEKICRSYSLNDRMVRQWRADICIEKLTEKQFFNERIGSYLERLMKANENIIFPYEEGDVPEEDEECIDE